MVTAILVLLRFAPTQSSDVLCVDQPDRAACVETVCRVSSGLDYDVTECDGLAEHMRANPSPYWQLSDDVEGVR